MVRYFLGRAEGGAAGLNFQNIFTTLLVPVLIHTSKTLMHITSNK